MKKNTVAILIATGLLGLASCSGFPTTPTDSSIIEESEIMRVYRLYQENGGTMTYEEWLNSIKGEQGPQGEQGPRGETGPKGDTGATGATGPQGSQGPQGEKGSDGKDGSSLITGSTDPVNTQGNDGDTYFNSTTGDVFVKVNGSWVKSGNIKGAQGEKGDTGATGSTGATGATGPQGPQGEKGATGEAGKDGATWLSGLAAPSDSEGNDGDFYLNTTTYDIYKKSNGVWMPIGNIQGKNETEKEDSVVADYSRTQSILYHSVNNQQTLLKKITGLSGDYKAIYVYKMGRIYNVPVSFGDAYFYTGIPMKLSFSKSNVVSSTVERYFSAVAEKAESVTDSASVSASASASMSATVAPGVKASVKASVSAELSEDTTVSYGYTSTQSTTNIQNTVETNSQELSYQLDGSYCRFGYSYRLTALCNLNVYAYVIYDKTTDHPKFVFDTTSFGTSFILEESNENGVFGTEDMTVRATAIDAFDYSKLVSDEFFKNAGCSAYTSLASSKYSFTADEITLLKRKGYTSIQYHAEWYDDDKNEITLPDISYTVNGMAKSTAWTYQSNNGGDDLARGANVIVPITDVDGSLDVVFNNYASGIETCKAYRW